MPREVRVPVELVLAVRDLEDELESRQLGGPSEQELVEKVEREKDSEKSHQTQSFPSTGRRGALKVVESQVQDEETWSSQSS